MSNTKTCIGCLALEKDSCLLKLETQRVYAQYRYVPAPKDLKCPKPTTDKMLSKCLKKLSKNK